MPGESPLRAPRRDYTHGMPIPTTSRKVDLSLLHPRFIKRLEAFFADPRVIGNVSVVSGCRSYAQQKYFYDKYKSGRGNLAANPDRRFGKGGWWRGSWHMAQDDSFCYAVDFRLIGKGLSTWECNNVAKEYGIHPTVKSEWWHHQPRNSNGWFDWDPEAKADKVEPKLDWAGILAYIKALGDEVARKALRRGSRGNAVKTMQARLGALGFDAGPSDGVFGRGTRKALRKFQRVEQLTADGICGKQTWARLWNPEYA